MVTTVWTASSEEAVSRIICALSLLIEDYHTFLKHFSSTSMPESSLSCKEQWQQVTSSFSLYSSCCVGTRAKAILGKKWTLPFQDKHTIIYRCYCERWNIDFYQRAFLLPTGQTFWRSQVIINYAHPGAQRVNQDFLSIHNLCWPT